MFLRDTVRPKSSRCLAAMLGLGLLVAVGCQAPIDRPPSTNLGGLSDAGTCPFPDEGCACAPGTDPIQCIVPPTVVAGRTVCQHGTRSCRDGRWTSCENVTAFVPSGNKILGSPTIADLCSPDAYTQISTPDSADLTPSNSTNLQYTTTPAPGGLVLIPSMTTLPNDGLGDDSDGDGAPDSVDACPSDPTGFIPTTPSGCLLDGLYHTLPPGESDFDPVDILLQVKTVDTYLLIDTTTSMQDEINNLKTGLSTLISSIQTSIPDANVGIGMYRDFPVQLDGNYNDFPYFHLLDPVADLATVDSVIDNVLAIDGNVLWPESGAQALYSMASGRGLANFLPNRTCTNGGFGYPCFRAGTVPVAIIITDAPFWNGPSFAAPASNSRSRSWLSHVPYTYPATTDYGSQSSSGSTNMAGTQLPPATVVSASGQVIRTNDTIGTAFDIGDITNRSVSVIGSNEGGSPAFVNNNNTKCPTGFGGVTQSGRDVYYTFSLTASRTLTIESFGDYDTTLFLRSGLDGTQVSCDRDSGSINDANGNVVWDTAARLANQALAAGTYTIVVDTSADENRGSFQLRITNASAPPTAADATASNEVPWATTAAALQARGFKTIGIASCPSGCTNLDTRQNTYETCVQGSPPTSTTTGADRINAPSATYCGAAYNRCISRSAWGTTALCTAIFDECRAREVYAGRNNLNVRDSACRAARDACEDEFPACPDVWVPNGCWSWRRWRWYDCWQPDPTCPDTDAECAAVENACRAGSAVCTAEAAAVSTCYTSAAPATLAGSQCDETLYDLDGLARATGSVRSDQTPFTFQIQPNGSGLTSTIADAVRELAQYILFDVQVFCEAPTGSAACTQLYAGTTVTTPDPSASATPPRCESCSGDACTGCTPGANLPFQVNFSNPLVGGVAPTSVPQVFDFFMVLRNQSGTEMSRTPVRIVVPPNLVQFAPSGNFQQVYDGTYDSVNMTGCPYPGRRADWGTFTYTVNVPAGTRIVFSFRTAETIAGLGAASPASVTVTASATGATVDVGEALVAAGLANYMPFLQVTASLYADSTLTLTPTLQSYTQQYTCVDAE